MCCARRFSVEAEMGAFFVDIPSSYTATTSLASKSLEELFLDTVKLNPTNKDKRKSKRVASRAEVRK